VKIKSNKSLVRNVLASVFGLCLVLGILNFKLESDRNEKNSKKSVSQSAQVFVGEDSDQVAQKESQASKEGANTSQGGNGESGSTSLDEKENSADSKTKISRKVAPYASGAGAWSVSTATKEQKKTYKIVSQIDPSRSISEILESAEMSDPETRAAVVAFMSNREEVRYQAVLAKAELLGIPVRLDGPGHKVSILYDFRGEEPLYRTTLNVNAAISTGANLIRQTAPYNLDGSGIKVGVWDGGPVRNTHQEFSTSRVVKKDSTATGDDHATHVAGTIGASGAFVQGSAKGMAPLVAIDSYEWTDDYAEMTDAGAATANDSFATKIPLSNHSYGLNAVTADMGRYEKECNTLDALALSLPYYLVFWAAGNEQDTLTALGGYQSITYNGLSKNILTVGAGDDAVTTGNRDITKGTLAYFSSMGPCDDGRIKPDLVANGVNLNSSVATSDTAYDATYSGTSMATPNAAGSSTLLVQLYSREFSGQRMRSSMLKALLIHTADDVGRPGPDYQYGWGYLNVKAAADLILAHKASLSVPKMVDDSISNASKTKTYSYKWDGISSLRATLCWTDPAGTAQTAANSRTPNLKHNLDLKITAPDGTTIYQPYTMPFVGIWTQASMILNATKGKNNVDNVERVDLPTPTQTGTYTVTVSLDGTLTTSTQAFSLVVTGASSVEANPPPTVSLTSPLNGAAALPGQSVTLTATAADMATGGRVGSVTQVEFLNGTTVISTDTTSPYSATWTPTSAGAYLLAARATDGEGAVTTSSQVEFSVLSGDGFPSISSLSPASGAAGASVTIIGSNFGGVTAVSFNGSPSTSYTVDSLTQITAIVPGAATSGKISVTNSFGTGTSVTNFEVIPVLLSEDFATLTTGTESSPSSTEVTSNLTANFPVSTKAYSAGGEVKLGSSTANGSITSKSLDLSGGAFEVSFDVKGWTTVEGDITVTVTGQTTQRVTYTSVMSGSFEAKLVRFSAGTAGATITLATTAKRAFLDNIKVTRVVGAPVISSSPTQAGKVDTDFSYQIAASGSPTSFGATVLPAWLTLNTTTGLIIGKPTGAGTFSMTISATNASGTGTATLVITISPSGGGGATSGLIAGWDFQTISNNGTAVDASPSTPKVYAANFGSGTLYLDGSNFSSNWFVPSTGSSNTELNGFTGSSLNTTGNGFSATTTSPAALGLLGGALNASNGKSIVFKFSMAGKKDLLISLSAQRTSTGFTTQTWEYSSNGSTWVTIKTLSSSTAGSGSTAVYSGDIRDAFSSTGIITLPTVTGLDNTAISYVRVTFSGATSASSNNRLDNIQLNATAAATERTVSTIGTLSPVNTTYGTASSMPTSFTVSGSNLTEGILINPPSGYEISQTAGGGSGYAATQTVTVGAAGTVNATTIYVRLKAAASVGTYSGSITCNSAESAGATVATVASSVAKKQLTITANNQTKPFGTNLTLGPGQKQFTVNVSDLVAGEVIDTVTLLASGGTEAQDSVGLYTLTASDPVPGALNLFRPENYECTFVSGKLNVVEGATFASWAGEGVAMTPELLMMYAIGGAKSPSAPGERPETKMEGTVLSLTAIVRKDDTLTIIGQAVTDLGNYGNSSSITQVSGSAVGVSQDGVPAGCERQKFTMDAGSARQAFLRMSVTK
jgi:Subtilase family/Bacterial Ig domain/Putative Ig domain